MIVILTISICFNVFQAVLFFLLCVGVKQKFKQIAELVVELAKEAENE